MRLRCTHEGVSAVGLAGAEYPVAADGTLEVPDEHVTEAALEQLGAHGVIAAPTDEWRPAPAAEPESDKKAARRSKE